MVPGSHSKFHVLCWAALWGDVEAQPNSQLPACSLSLHEWPLLRCHLILVIQNNSDLCGLDFYR